ncbi:hypothetical protein EON82_15540 [bacterium]|nr:MAG: hypothetical protein EON82_15540 [bacterium]
MPDLATTKDIALVIGGVAALTTFLTGLVEYARQANLRRGEAFIAMRRRFLEDPLFRDILNLLDADDPRLAELPVQDRRNFVGFLEEVALMSRSKMIRPEVAHYMFGRYVSLADASEHLWKGIDKGGRYWTLFRRYAAENRALEGGPEPQNLRF